MSLKCDFPIQESVWRCVLVVYMVFKVYQVILFANSQLHTRPSGHGGLCLVYSPHQDTVKCFVNKGADFDIKDDGRVSEWRVTADILLIRVCSQPPDQWSGIHWCWLYTSYMLPCYSWCTMFTSSHQMTPLHWAPGIDHVDTVTCVVDKGANTSTKDEVSECEYTADWSLFPVTSKRYCWTYSIL